MSALIDAVEVSTSRADMLLSLSFDETQLDTFLTRVAPLLSGMLP
jgi:hypothetical protein